MNKELLIAFQNLAKINKIDLEIKAHFLDKINDPELEAVLRNSTYEQLFNIRSVIFLNKKLKTKFDTPYFKQLLEKLMKEKLNSHVNKFSLLGRNGLWVFKSIDRVKMSEGMFNNNKEEGDWFYYWPEGTISIEGSFKNGLKDGVWKIYDRGEQNKQGPVHKNVSL